MLSEKRIFTILRATVACSIIRSVFISITAPKRLPWPSEGSNGTLCVFIICLWLGSFRFLRVYSALEWLFAPALSVIPVKIQPAVIEGELEI